MPEDSNLPRESLTPFDGCTYLEEVARLGTAKILDLATDSTKIAIYFDCLGFKYNATSQSCRSLPAPITLAGQKIAGKVVPGDKKSSCFVD